MVDYSIKSCSRRCATSDEEIRPGESYYSMVTIDEDGELFRKDFRVEVWDGPEEGCIGFWKSEIPNPQDGRVYWAPNEVLFSYFDQLLESNASRDLIYVMAILLVRKRLLKMIETRRSSSGEEIMVLSSSRHKGEMQVEVAKLDPEQIEKIQSELGEHLFTNKLAGESQPDESELK